MCRLVGKVDRRREGREQVGFTYLSVLVLPVCEIFDVCPFIPSASEIGGIAIFSLILFF